MNGRTHLIIGIAIGMGTADALGVPPVVGAALGAVGGLLPDIDHPQSLITSFVPFGWLISGAIGGHRGITHSVLCIAIASLAARQLLPDDYLIVIVSAYLSHLLADCATPDGVPLLYPLRMRFKLLPSVILQYVDFIAESAALIAALIAIVYLVSAAYMS